MDMDLSNLRRCSPVLVGVAAAAVVDVSTGLREVAAQESVATPVPRPSVSTGPTTRAGCPTQSTTRPKAVQPPVPLGPPDWQLNSSGTHTAGGGGGAVGIGRTNDPCDRANVLNIQIKQPPDAASAPPVPDLANPARQP